MANFTPQGIVKIGRVPFDNSYRHTMTFASRTAQSVYFSSVCPQSLQNSTYTYVRMNNSIRVPFNAEQLYTYNYVMYQNANYGTKWFYAFIVDINYINENTTELVLELDVMQTWYFDYTLVKGFVEREHVNDDSIGAHLNAEPSMDMQYKTQSILDYYSAAKWVVLMVNAYPHYFGGEKDVKGNDPCEGGIYHRQYNACKFLVYDVVSSAGRAKLKQDINAYNLAGAAESICDAFTVPLEYLPSDQQEDFHDWYNQVQPNVKQMKENTTPPMVSFTRNRPSSHGGYVPRNNKLFTYPYMYEEMGDYTGRVQDWRYEFGNSNGSLTFDRIAPVCSDMTIYLWARNYNGVEIESEGDKPPICFTVDIANKVSWVYSTYQNWAAQNATTNQLAVIGSVATMGFSFMPGLSAASGLLGRGAGLAARDAALGLSGAAERTHAAYSQAAGRVIAENSSKGALGGGAAGLASVAATYDRMSKIPNTAKGNVGGNARFQSRFAGFYSRSVTLLPEFARIIDGFFDMYGYQVDSVKVPNRTGRPNWNYVKMQNSCHRGNVPADDMAKINSIYDAGITFWHTTDIGNYTLNNK